MKATLLQYAAAMKMKFDKSLIPEKAEYAAHRIAVLAPTYMLTQADRYLNDPQFNDVRAQWSELRESTIALLQRCTTALRRLEGDDAALPDSDEDLGMFAGFAGRS